MSEARDQGEPGDEGQQHRLQDAVRAHPVRYLLGAAALGFVVARLVRRER
jgi:hypothetical protein